MTENLELGPRQWKVTQHVREKYSCRRCEQITQPPAPSHPIARGRAGPGLLAHLLFGKYRMHLALTRQTTAFTREGIETLVDWVGAAAATLMPLVEAIRARVFWPSGSMPTTRPCWCSTSARRAPDDCGPTCATIGPPPALIAGGDDGGALCSRQSSSTATIERCASCAPAWVG